MDKNKSKIIVQSSGSAKLLNRYLSYATHKIFTEENILAKEWSQYEVQWQNIRDDLKSLFINPIQTLPKVAMSLAAFWFIVRGNHNAAFHMAFMGAITAGTKGGTGNATSISVTTLSTTTKTIGLAGAHGTTNGITGMSLNGSALTQVIKNGPNDTAAIYFKDNPGALTSVTLSGTYSGGNPDSYCIGYLNLEGTENGTADVTSTTSGNSNTASLTLTPSVNNCILICCGYSEAPFTQGSGETNIFAVTGAQSFENCAASYVIQTTAAAQNMDFALGFGTRWNLVGAIFRVSGSSASLSASPSSSQSPSASSSRSVSPSASISPSSSSSRSISPSASLSPSSSVSRSISPSASSSSSVSPSASQSPSASVSASISPSSSRSPSSSSSPSIPPFGAILKRWTGSAWVKAKLMAYIGGSFQNKPLKYWNGSQWVSIDNLG